MDHVSVSPSTRASGSIGQATTSAAAAETAAPDKPALKKRPKTVDVVLVIGDGFERGLADGVEFKAHVRDLSIKIVTPATVRRSVFEALEDLQDKRLVGGNTLGLALLHGAPAGADDVSLAFRKGEPLVSGTALVQHLHQGDPAKSRPPTGVAWLRTCFLGSARRGLAAVPGTHIASGSKSMNVGLPLWDELLDEVAAQKKRRAAGSDAASEAKLDALALYEKSKKQAGATAFIEDGKVVSVSRCNAVEHLRNDPGLQMSGLCLYVVKDKGLKVWEMRAAFPGIDKEILLGKAFEHQQYRAAAALYFPGPTRFSMRDALAHLEQQGCPGSSLHLVLRGYAQLLLQALGKGLPQAQCLGGMPAGLLVHGLLRETSDCASLSRTLRQLASAKDAEIALHGAHAYEDTTGLDGPAEAALLRELAAIMESVANGGEIPVPALASVVRCLMAPAMHLAGAGLPEATVKNSLVWPSLLRLADAVQARLPASVAAYLGSALRLLKESDRPLERLLPLLCYALTDGLVDCARRTGPDAAAQCLPPIYLVYAQANFDPVRALLQCMGDEELDLDEDFNLLNPVKMNGTFGLDLYLDEKYFAPCLPILRFFLDDDARTLHDVALKLRGEEGALTVLRALDACR
ncbi:MAG: hypothetical protein JWP36_1041 [Paucimonas sp.]|nr:hypothetical protein [Paucimonas sp.]